MILVSVHTVDSTGVEASSNGAYGIMFYNLVEAKSFAQLESQPIGSGSPSTMSWCRVYNDGVLIATYINGVEI